MCKFDVADLFRSSGRRRKDDLCRISDFTMFAALLATVLVRADNCGDITSGTIDHAALASAFEKDGELTCALMQVSFA